MAVLVATFLVPAYPYFFLLLLQLVTLLAVGIYSSSEASACKNGEKMNLPFARSNE